MKNREQANKKNNLSDPAIANDPQSLVEDLPISSEQEEQVKGGFIKSWSVSNDADDRPTSSRTKYEDITCVCGAGMTKN